MRSFTKLVYIFLTIVLVAIVMLIVFDSLHLGMKNERIAELPMPDAIIAEKSPPLCKNNIMTILSIDGGGSKGIIPLYFLTQIEKNTHQSIRANFDLMSGVSAGALITTTLSISNANKQPVYTSEQLMQMYSTFSSTLFDISLFRKILSVNGLISPQFSSADK